MNTFGVSTSQGLPLYDPREIIQSRQRFRRDTIPSLNRATSIYIPTGRYPSRGWILLARKDYDTLNRYGTTFQLEVGNSRKEHNTAALGNLSIVQAQCVTRGIESEKNALYLVELTDGRGILHNKWFQFPLVEWYNIRAPAYPSTDRGGTFYPASMNGGTTWTWSTMLQDIWNQMSAFLGTWPGLPAGYTADSTPEGYWFPGVPAWTALNDVLEDIGLTIACDLTLTNPFTIVQPGAADSAFTALQTKYATATSPLYRLEDDLEWIDIGAGRVPKTIKVLFRRRNSVYGTEETVYYGNDTLAEQWIMDPIYTVSVTAPAAFTSAVGTHYLWSDYTLRYDDNGDPFSADIARATTLAQEDVEDYFARIYGSTLGHMSQTYAGALPFKTGSRVDGVCYYQDYRNDDRGAWRTQIVRGCKPPWPGLWD